MNPLTSLEFATCLRVAIVGLTTSPLLLADVSSPQGKISTDRKIVLPTSVVDVRWRAEYPQPLSKLVKREKETLTVTTKMRADVRVIGAAFGPVTKPYPVRGWVKTSVATSWQEIFLGNIKTYNPQTVVWSKILAPNEVLDFKFQGSYDNSYTTRADKSLDIKTIGSWQPAIDTTPSSPRPYNRAVYFDGETVPDLEGQLEQPSVHQHLAPYFKSGTKVLKLGEMDAIYLTELSPFNKGDKSTDMQDLVLLVTFTAIDDVTKAVETWYEEEFYWLDDN